MKYREMLSQCAHLCVFTYLDEIHRFLFEIVSQSHKIKIAGHKHQTMSHRCRYELW